MSKKKCSNELGFVLSHEKGNERRTARGFRIFGETDRVLVVESSLALEGPHVRVYGGRGSHEDDHVHLSLEDAIEVRDALNQFICEAKANQLTENVSEGS